MKQRELEESYEASSIMNHTIAKPNNINNSNSFRHRSLQRKGQSLVNTVRSARDATPNNPGERLYKYGLKLLEEKERRTHQEKMIKEMNEVEDATFQPRINPISKFFGRNDGK